jgi:hypothetical protein
MFLSEGQFNPNYLQKIVDHIDEFLKERGFRQRFKKNIRGGRYDNFHQIFFDWDGYTDERELINKFLKKIQKKLYKDMRIFMAFYNKGASVSINFRNWYFKRVLPPKYLYHSTDSLENVKSILKNGIVAKDTWERWSHSLAYPELVFFESEPNNRWGKYTFKIDTEKLKDYKFYTDINLDAKGEGFAGGKHSYITNKSIDPSNIELMDSKRLEFFLKETVRDKLKSKVNSIIKQKVNFLIEKGITDETRELFMKSIHKDNEIYNLVPTNLKQEIDNYVTKFINEITNEIDLLYNGKIDYISLKTLMEKYSIEHDDMYFLVERKMVNYYKEREKDLIDDIKFVVDEEFNGEIPDLTFSEIYRIFLDYQPMHDYSKEEVRKMFAKLFNDPKQLKLFEKKN